MAVWVWLDGVVGWEEDAWVLGCFWAGQAGEGRAAREVRVSDVLVGLGR